MRSSDDSTGIRFGSVAPKNGIAVAKAREIVRRIA